MISSGDVDVNVYLDTFHSHRGTNVSWQGTDTKSFQTSFAQFMLELSSLNLTTIFLLAESG